MIVRGVLFQMLEKVVGEKQILLLGAQMELVVEMAQHMPKVSDEAPGDRGTMISGRALASIFRGVRK